MVITNGIVTLLFVWHFVNLLYQFITLVTLMCQHFSGHKFTQIFAVFRILLVTNSHLQSEFSLDYKGYVIVKCGILVHH